MQIRSAIFTRSTNWRRAERAFQAATLRVDSRAGVTGRELARARLWTFHDRVLHYVSQAEQRIPGVLENDLARFAIEDLFPGRLNLACSDVADIDLRDARHLARFLQSLERTCEAELIAAHQADQVADATLRAAENLHSYLLAHEIVGGRYARPARAEKPWVRRQVARPHSPASWPPPGRGSVESTRSAAADSHEYALSA